ncbi:hypothetical protein DsansV1_C34g0224661 [Dioscorea sansibarensis]
MEWKKGYMDMILVPMGVVCSVLYHGWLWHKVRSQPFQTFIGINSAARRQWALSIIKDNEKNNILAVQTLRNAIMGSTLMATTSILFCSGLAAIISSTYTVKKVVGDIVLGAHGELMMALKYVILLIIFLLAFLFYSLSIGLLNQVNFLINIPVTSLEDVGVSPVRQECYILDMMDRGFVLSTLGNRLFYTAVPLLLWIFGPLLVFFCSMAMVLILYKLDMVPGGPGKLRAVGDEQISCSNHVCIV